ncbi:helix-turn-helix domain-containing protein [Streptomyces sp. ODS28]|uniref:TetR/AcrR family transcriptional regulator n=1 Tax=Streptomyces sp. ODS28 TaxID=3136688 RepID=UPI0031E9A4E8
MTHAAEAGSGSGGGVGNGAGAQGDGAPRTTPLRVDAQRNLEHVLRAAREVFGELGYGAPMEDVARRARVGVGTVYRRFPSKDVLVRRIAEEETARLTEQARSALGQEEDPWAALSRFLRTSVASGAGRLLPPRILRADGVGPVGAGSSGAAVDGSAEHGTRVPQQRLPGEDAANGSHGAHGSHGAGPLGQPGDNGLRLVDGGRAGQQGHGSGAGPEPEPDSAAELLGVVGQLVERAREAGELRTDVTVGDVLLVIATAAPSLPDAAQQAAASKRLLDILLEGLRSR